MPTIALRTRGTRNLIPDEYPVLWPILDIQAGEDKVQKGHWVQSHNVTSNENEQNMVTRPGYAQCNAASLANEIDGIHRFYKTSSVTETLYVQGGKLYKVTSDWDTPTEITKAASASLGLTNGSKVMFVTIALPGESRQVAFLSISDGLYYYDGTDGVKIDIPKVNDSGNITGALSMFWHPVGRLCVIGATDSGQENVIFWGEAGANWTNFDHTTSDSLAGYSTLYHDDDSLRATCGGPKGDDIVVMLEAGGYIVRDWDKFDSSGSPLVPSIKSFTNKGCIAPYSFQKWDRGFIWLARQGIFLWQSGLPIPLSGDIFPKKGRTFSTGYANLADIFAVIHRDQYMLCYNNTAESLAYNNRMLVCDLPRRTWTEFRNMTFRCGVDCVGGADKMQQLYLGSANSAKGFIWRWAEREDNFAAIYTDNFDVSENDGDAISVEAQSGWSNGGYPNHLKRLECIEIEYDTIDGGGGGTPALTTGRIDFYTDDNETKIGSVNIDEDKKFQRLYFPETERGTATFTGAGLDDLTAGGTFTGLPALAYRVQIDGTGTPDTFKWSNDGGVTWEATKVAITGAAQTLENGVTVTFGATTGHTVANYWDIPTNLNLYCRKYKVKLYVVCDDRAVVFKRFTLWFKLFDSVPDST